MTTARFLAWTTALLGLVTLAGCIPSLNAVYTHDDVVYEPSVVGVWSQPDSKAKWEFSRHEGDSYRLLYTDEKGQQGRFIAHLARINGTLFLDLYPEESGVDASDFYKFHLVPIHTIYRVKSTGPKLGLSVIDYQWLDKYLTEHPDEVHSATFNGRKLLTGPTEEVQAFVVKHQNAFTGDVKLERVAENVN